MTANHKATRVQGGGYDYRGYRLQHPENEDGTLSSDWDICEDDGTGYWIACDRVSQLWVAKEMVDGWKRANNTCVTDCEHPSLCVFRDTEMCTK